jgi:hypothetical protein
VEKHLVPQITQIPQKDVPDCGMRISECGLEFPPSSSNPHSAFCNPQSTGPHSALLCVTTELNRCWYSVDVMNEHTIPR